MRDYVINSDKPFRIANRSGGCPGSSVRDNIMTIPVDYGDADWLLERLSKFHNEYQQVEREYLELRILLRDAEAALRAEPEDGNMRVRVSYLKRRLEDLEGKYPWITSGKPPEIAFWIPLSG
jgi:hypothetical protein